MAKNKNKTSGTTVVSETKEAKFTRIVLPRVNKAVKSIGLIGNCAGPGYANTPEQAEEIMIALTDALTALATKFRSAKSSAQEFKFTQ